MADEKKMDTVNEAIDDSELENVAGGMASLSGMMHSGGAAGQSVKNLGGAKHLGQSKARELEAKGIGSLNKSKGIGGLNKSKDLGTAKGLGVLNKSKATGTKKSN